MGKHKTLGQVFTPTWIVNEILDYVGYNDESILERYILEPACGNGAFLSEIVRRYIFFAKKQGLTALEIINSLGKYIYGVELDTLEYQKCIESLNSLVEESVSINNRVDWKIFNQNTLSFYKDYLSFFDFVVGNPPYIRIHNLESEIRTSIKKEFNFSVGTIDIYLTFFEMGIKMLNNSGKLGYITPNSYLHNSSYKRFRDYLKNQQILTTLIDFKSNKIFKGFSTYTAITILDKNFTKKEFQYKEFVDNKILTVNTIQFKDLDAEDWTFSCEKDEKFLSNLSTNSLSRISDFFDVQYGFATLRDRIFISKIISHSDELVYFNNELIEKSILRKVIKGSKFKGNIEEIEYIIYPYELIKNKYRAISEEKLQEKFPFAYKYLLKNKEELLKRDLDKGANWYEFGRSQGLQTIHNEKIVLSTLVNGNINFYKLPKDIMVYSGIFIIKNKTFSEWTALESVLKSEDFYRYIRLTGKDFSGGYKLISSKQIKDYKIEVQNPSTLF